MSSSPASSNDDVSRALEWSRFLELARKEARTEPAKNALGALLDPAAWAQSVTESRTRQQETQEMLPLLERDALWGPLVDLVDPDPRLDRLSRGSTLELPELASIRRWLYALDSWTQVPREEIRGERFKKALTQLADPHEPLRRIERILTPEGELSERASPKLAAITAEIRALKREIGAILDQTIKSLSQKGVLQDTISDVRDGRFVVPVKISNQG
ncbi:MAG: hypothetical protein ACXWPM_07865, partial [Bdellovibrionota bacterium]